MARPLGLHQTTAMDLTPEALIDAAAACRYDHVSLFTHNPSVPIEGQAEKFVFPKVTEANLAAVRVRLDTHGLRVVNAEFFLMRPEVDPRAYEPGLMLARAIGARHAVTHVFEPDRDRAADILATFCDLAGEYDLKVAIEFCRMTPGCGSIEEATWFVDRAAKPNLGFGICPMHLVRSGGTADQVRAAGSRVLFGQVNDARGLHASSAYFDEVHDRALPGDGDFPLAEILLALPADAPIEVKIPSDSRIRSGGSAQAYIQEAFARTRAILDAMDRGEAER